MLKVRPSRSIIHDESGRKLPRKFTRNLLQFEAADSTQNKITISYLGSLHKTDIEHGGLYSHNLFTEYLDDKDITIKVTRTGPGDAVRFTFSAPFSDDKMLLSIKFSVNFGGEIADQLDQKSNHIEKTAEFHITRADDGKEIVALQEATVELTSLEYACTDVIVMYCEKPAKGIIDDRVSSNPISHEVSKIKEEDKDTILQQLATAWRNLLHIQNNGDMEFRERYYLAAVKQIQSLKYSAKDVEECCALLAKFQNVSEFSIRAGLFLSALINCGSDNTYVIHTNNPRLKVHYLGYLNRKIININGDAGNYLGFGMKRGVITVDAAGDFLAYRMEGGRIYVKGSVGVSSGQFMIGGEFHYNRERVSRLVMNSTP